MAKSLNELRKKIKPEVQAAAREKAVNIIAEMKSGGTKIRKKGDVVDLLI